MDIVPYIRDCTRHSRRLINYSLAPSGSLDEGERNRFVYFPPAERQAVAEFVEYRFQLEGAEFDRQYLEQARAYWRAR